MSDQFTTISDDAAEKHHLTLEEQKTSSMTITSIVYGVVAGVLMSLFVGVSGYYITGDNAAFGFLKLLILGAAIYPLLVKTKAATPAGTSVKNMIPNGLLAGGAAGIVSGIAVVLFNGRKAISSEVENATDVAGNQFALAGINFFICLVAALIFTLIFSQLLKDARPER